MRALQAVRPSSVDELAFDRVVNKPTRGIGKATLQTLHGLARAEGRSLHAAALQLVETDELKPAARRSLAGIVQDFDRWRRRSQDVAHTDLAETDRKSTRLNSSH